MEDAALAAALTRIDRALARLERIDPGAPAAGIAEAYARLDERHDILRLRVQETIERIDALMAEDEG